MLCSDEMPSSQINRLETVLEEATQRLNIQTLNILLQKNVEERITIQCSQHFLNKLDKFICKSLEHGNSSAASLGFSVIYKWGKNLKLPGGQGLSALITQGLVKMMLQWFEKCRQVWVLGGSLRDENLLNLAEDFFDALMEVHESGNAGVIQVTESFLYPIGHVAVDTRIYILIQKEAIRKFNMILEKCPKGLKKDSKILRSQEAADIMTKIVSNILSGGDYDFQTALMEAIFRMATSEQRKHLADRWFPMAHVSALFVKLKDSEFETDCRKFLNMVNGMKGDNKSIFSYPCLDVHLGKTELLMPADEKLEEFWIDFNIGSQSISFYVSLPDEDAQEGQWETICINDNEVKSYTVRVAGKRKVLQLDLSEVVVVGSVEGSTLTIHFSCGLEILPVIQKLFGYNKNTGFVGKIGSSVVKTTVKVILDENSATPQIVPESQFSFGESDKTVAHVQIKTPDKIRLSESTTYISSSGGGGARSVSAVLPAVKSKGRASLEMLRSFERPEQIYLGELRTTAKSSPNITPITARRDAETEQTQTLKTTESDKNKKTAHISKVKAVVLPGPSEVEPPLDSTFVPDSQPTTGKNISSNWHRYSVSEMLMLPTQKMCSLTISGSPQSSAQKLVCPSSAQRTSAPSSGPIHPKQLHAELTQRLQEVLIERNQAPSPRTISVQKRKMSYSDTDLKPKSSVALTEFVAPDMKETKRPQRNSKAKAKNKIKSQMEEDAVKPQKEEDIVVVKAPVKAAEENMSLTVKSTALSSKEKEDAEVTGKMVKHISSHYEVNSLIKVKGNKITQSFIPPLIDRPFFNMKWHTCMGKVTTLVKSNSKTKTSPTRQSKDVFAFNADTPQSIGLNRGITSSAFISVTDEDSRLPSSKKKELPPPKPKRYVKKHLFSDTDTDRGATDVSWVRESSRKPKPKVVKYPRQAPAKPKVTEALPSCDSPGLPASSVVPLKANTKSTKDVSKSQQKKEKAAPAQSKDTVTSRRPSRAATNTLKNYKEVESDESQSESELSKVGKSGKPQESEKRSKKSNTSKSCIDPESNNSHSESEMDQPYFTKPKYFVDESKIQGKKLTTRPQQAINKKQENKITIDLQKSCEKQLKPVNVPKESAENPKKPSKKNVALVKEQTATLKPSWAERQTVSPPPSFIERMRSAAGSGPSLDVPCSPVLSLQISPLTVSPPYIPDTLTPVLLLPKRRSTAPDAEDLKTPSFYSAEKKQNASRLQSIKSVTSLTARGFSKSCVAIRTSAVQSPVQQDLTSPAQSPLSFSQPLMMSTQVNQDRPALASVPQSPFPEVHSNRSSHHSFTKMSQVSEASLSHVSSKSSVTGKVKDMDAAQSFGLRAEETPQMDDSLNSVIDVVSGPSRKRHFSYSSSNSDEEEKEQIKKCKMRTQHSPRMKPRKLFKSSSNAQDSAKSRHDQSDLDKTRIENKTKVTKKKSMEENVSAKKKRCKTHICEDIVTEVSAEGGVSQLLSSSHTVISGQWDADVEDADIEEDMDGSGLNPRDMCREFSCKLQQKFKSRFKMVEVYNKQSLKSVQQHISTISSEVAKHRAQDLEQVQRVLLEEVHKLEQDDTVLKNMENDLTIYWNKQTVAFRSLQKQGKRRNEVLRKTLENNLCHSLEHEERVFTSQMCLIKKDMKSAQDRLVNEMHDGEIQNVKRGLHALFFPDAAKF